MFDAIAPTYDLLNHLLSLGIDRYWRWRAVKLLAEKHGGRILDVAAGTGDLAIAILKLKPAQIVLLDFVERMLVQARKKVADRSDHTATDGQNAGSYVVADAALLPFRRASFDVVMVAFGIRNFPNKPAALRSMHYALKPGGLLCVLELSRPRGKTFARLFRWYFHSLAPAIGRRISRHPDAYSYLPESVDDFPEASDFLRMIEQAGFGESKCVPLTFGVASIFLGRKN